MSNRKQTLQICLQSRLDQSNFNAKFNALACDQGWLRLVIADFGISRILTSSELQVKAFTISTLKCASINYAAPEVLFRLRGGFMSNDTSSWKAGDVYALSMTALEMLKRKSVWYE